MSAESPIVVLDDPAIGFDHGRGIWRGVDVDMYYLVGAIESPLTGLGADTAPGGMCPPCSYFQGDRCYWCPSPEHPAYPSDRPECAGCLGRDPPKVPWYRREDIMVPLLTSIAVSTAAAVFSTMILKRTGYAGA